MPNIQDTTQKRVRFQNELIEKYGLTGDVFLISTEHYDLIEHKPGVVIPAAPDIAARMVFKHTHRLATDEEIAQYRAELQERTEQYDRLESERRMREGKFAVIQQQAAAPSQNENELALQLVQLRQELAEMSRRLANAESVAPSPKTSGKQKSEA